MKSPCDLVSVNDVRDLEPSVTKAEANEKYAGVGLMMCSWLDEGGDPKFSVALRQSRGGTVRETFEAGGMFDNGETYFEVDGLGDSAGAVFSARDETFDHPPQLLQLMVKKGDYELTAMPLLTIEDPDSDAFLALKALVTEATNQL